MLNLAELYLPIKTREKVLNLRQVLVWKQNVELYQ